MNEKCDRQRMWSSVGCGVSAVLCTPSTAGSPASSPANGPSLHSASASDAAHQSVLQLQVGKAVL